MGNKKKVEEEVVLTPEVPEGETPETPEVPEGETPETPEVPEGETPEVPEVPEGETPEVPEESVKNGLILTHGLVTANKLNVRKEADKEADVLTVISKGTGVGIDLANSTEEFYCVQVIVDAELATGYCMKEFISTN